MPAFRTNAGYAKTWEKPRFFRCFTHLTRVANKNKTTENRSWGLFNYASHADHVLNLAWDSSGSILEGSGSLLGASWALLGQLWGTLGRLWVLSGGRPGPRFWRVWGRARLCFEGLWGHVLACLRLLHALCNIVFLFVQ